ncbi:MAG: hypothetical protein HFH45_01235 [Bacilli bacterium]|nr:hypothetical protein [Bacilli bacterium]
MISYYELLTLIKEGKQPDKVKYNGYIYYYDDVQFISYIKEVTLLEQFADYGMFDKNIEIIEEKPKEIEKIEINGEYYLPSKELCDDYEFKKFVLDDLQVRNKTIEEIRKAVNYLLKESKHE